jgi:hypothetical protein
MDLIPRPTMLVRQTNAYWGLSPEDRLRWDAATTLAAREAIEQEHRTRHGLDDLFGEGRAGAAAEQAEQGAPAALETAAEREERFWQAAIFLQELAAEQAAEQEYEPENNLYGDLDAFGT